MTIHSGRASRLVTEYKNDKQSSKWNKHLTTSESDGQHAPQTELGKNGIYNVWITAATDQDKPGTTSCRPRPH